MERYVTADLESLIPPAAEMLRVVDSAEATLEAQRRYDVLRNIAEKMSDAAKKGDRKVLVYLSKTPKEEDADWVVPMFVAKGYTVTRSSGFADVYVISWEPVAVVVDARCTGAYDVPEDCGYEVVLRCARVRGHVGPCGAV